jgi:hypothetical protein
MNMLSIIGRGFLDGLADAVEEDPHEDEDDIPVMTPLQYNDLHVRRSCIFRRGGSDPFRLTDIGACDRSQPDVRPVSDLRRAVAKTDVITASRHPRFRPVDDENYPSPGTTHRHRSRPVR